jgi:dsDNA-binding SOS-regulon protein
MTIIIKYVVEHKGIEKLVTTDKKEADKYDKMLEIADNLASYIHLKSPSLSEQEVEDLSILLSSNKDSIMKLFKGSAADQILDAEKAEVVSLEDAKA